MRLACAPGMQYADKEGIWPSSLQRRVVMKMLLKEEGEGYATLGICPAGF